MQEQDGKLLVSVLVGTLPELSQAQAEAIVAQRSGSSTTTTTTTASA